MKQLLSLMRPKHYLKNLLVFLPLIFSGQAASLPALGKALGAFGAFCLLASAVYIFNDICDRASDQHNPHKRSRPLASGAVRPAQAAALALLLLVLTAGLCVFLSAGTRLCLACYALVNLAYSLELKNIPLLDAALLAFGFLLRVLCGAAAVGVHASGWLCLTVTFLSLFICFGKRRSELRCGAATRGSARFYTDGFLTLAMQLCLAAALIAYTLWCLFAATNLAGRRMLATLPLAVWICLRYDRLCAKSEESDPVALFLRDAPLILLSIAYAIVTFCLLYAF